MNHYLATFTRVKDHLLKQDARSYGVLPNGRMGCAYRDSRGRSCAVGCLISDEHYSPDLEGDNLNNTDIQNAVKMSGIQWDDDMKNMLLDLQEIHDNTSVEYWSTRLSLFRDNHQELFSK